MKKPLIAILSVVSLVSFAQLEFSGVDKFQPPFGTILVLEDLFNTVLWQGGFNPTAADYVQDGLLVMWDGIENVGWGDHDPDAIVWKDLIGGNDLTNEGATVLSDGFKVSTGVLTKDDSAPFPVGTSDGSNKTLEIVCSSLKGLEVTVISPLANESMGFAKRTYHNSFYPYSCSSSYSYCDPNNNNLLSYRHFSISYTTYRSGSVIIDGSNTYSLSGNSRRGFNGSKFCVGAVYGRTLSNYTVHCIRLYSRKLTSEEIAYNYSIDKIRFNLP